MNGYLNVKMNALLRVKNNMCYVQIGVYCPETKTARFQISFKFIVCMYKFTTCNEWIVVLNT